MQPRAPHPAAFWVGLFLMALFTVAGLGGAARATDRILMERALQERGQWVEGRVLSRELVSTGTPARSGEDAVYRLRYRFSLPGGVVTGDARVSGSEYSGTGPGDVVRIRYLPGNPVRNLPPGAQGADLYGFFALFGLVTGLAGLIVLIGMIVGGMRIRRVRVRSVDTASWGEPGRVETGVSRATWARCDRPAGGGKPVLPVGKDAGRGREEVVRRAPG